MFQKFSIVVAVNSKNGIGVSGKIPWRILDDVKFFKKLTSTPTIPDVTNIVIMGRVTWESLPGKLKDRLNIVITSKKHISDDVHIATDLESALNYANSCGNLGEIFVIGGEQLYNDALKHELCENIYMTQIDEDSECDRFFPSDISDFVLQKKSKDFSQNGTKYRFLLYKKNNVTHQCNQGERGYLELVRKILYNGTPSVDRTGVGTISVFGEKLSFDLTKGFPLLTTKKIYWKGIVEELLWFLKGDTNANHLSEKGVKIWEKNGSREFLDSLGFKDRSVGDLGPVYGFQWRHFGAEYIDCNTDYEGKGIDQIAECIRLIKEDPSSRRIICTAWNVCDLNKMALPPCHLLIQFYVRQGRLSACLFQRSCDIGLGVPFNIASYALLIHIIAEYTDTIPYKFEYFLGDTHIYNNHITELRQQLERQPRKFPKLVIPKIPNKIEDLKFSDIQLIDYDPHPTIKMEMAV